MGGSSAMGDCRVTPSTVTSVVMPRGELVIIQDGDDESHELLSGDGLDLSPGDPGQLRLLEGHQGARGVGSIGDQDGAPEAVPGHRLQVHRADGDEHEAVAAGLGDIGLHRDGFGRRHGVVEGVEVVGQGILSYPKWCCSGEDA